MKTFYRFLLSIILIILQVGCSSVPMETISKDNLLSHIEVFTSVDYKGRLMGTDGNQKTIDYIDNYFDKIDLLPVGGDTFTHDFNGVNFSYEGDLRFDVLDTNGDIVKSYKRGVDYIVRMNDGAVGGRFIGSMNHIEKYDMVVRNEYSYDDLAILLDYTDKSILDTHLSKEQVDDRIYYKDAKVIIYPEFNDLNKQDIKVGSKNTYFKDKGIIKVGVNPDIYYYLVNYSKQGYTVDIDIPIAFHEVKSANIVGMIEGRRKDYKNIIIATSIDGYGVNEDGVIYEGATENAASMSIFLELSRILTSTNKKFDANIIFLALNGTRLGDRGFDNYFRIEGIQPVRSEVIYIDKLGSINDLTVGTYTGDSIQFKKNNLVFNELINTLKNLKTDFIANENYLNSDYLHFRSKGIVSYTITASENEFIGTVDDTIQHIDYNSVEQTGNIILTQLEKQGNMNILGDIILLIKSIWWLLVVFILLVIEKYKFLKGRQLGKLGKCLNSKPIISIYLIIMFFLMVIIIQTKQDIVLYQGIPFGTTKMGYMDILNAVFNNLLSSGFMLTLFLIYTVPLLLALVVLRYIYDKVKFSKQSYLLIVGLITFICILYGFEKFYSYEYSSIFPLFLALPNAHIIVILLIGLYSYLLTYFINKEVRDISYLKLVIVFIFTYFVFFIVLYSPYIFNSTIVNIRNSGGRIPY